MHKFQRQQNVSAHVNQCRLHRLTWVDNFHTCINSLPNDKILDVTKLKAFAEYNIYVGQMMISVSDRVENIVRKGENAGYQHFLLLSPCFQKAFFLGVIKSQEELSPLIDKSSTLTGCFKASNSVSLEVSLTREGLPNLASVYLAATPILYFAE